MYSADNDETNFSLSLSYVVFFSIDRLTINAVRGQFFTRLWILANPFCNAADFLCRVTMAFNESDILRSAALHLALLARYFAFDWTFFSCRVDDARGAPLRFDCKKLLLRARADSYIMNSFACHRVVSYYILAP